MKLGEATILGFELVNSECSGNDQAQNIDVNRLVIEIVRAQTHGAHGVDSISMFRDDDDFGMRRERDDFLESAESLVDVLLVGRHP